MTHSKGYGMSRWGLGVLAAALLTGCGGSVDLRSEGSGGSSGKTGVNGSGSGGDSFHPGGSGNPGAGSTGSGGTTYLPQLTPGPVAPAAEPTVVDDGITQGQGDPSGGIFAFDANRGGAGRAIYLSTLDNPDCNLRLTSPSVQAKQPVFSPDRVHLAYAAQTEGTYQIHVLNLESGVVEQVTNLHYGATAPSYSPDGKKLAFISGDNDAAGGNPVEGLFDVMVLDLEEQTQRVVLSSFDRGCCVPNVRAPTFFSNDEIALSTGTELIAIDLPTFTLREVMPTSGRIPNPQDPTPSPDGVRYVYADRCDGSLSLFIGRTDGSSGDSCVGATKIPAQFEYVSPAWGPGGYILAALKADVHGLVLFDDETFVMADLLGAEGGNNPAWAPTRVSLALECE